MTALQESHANEFGRRLACYHYQMTDWWAAMDEIDSITGARPADSRRDGLSLTLEGAITLAQARELEARRSAATRLERLWEGVLASCVRAVTPASE